MKTKDLLLYSLIGIVAYMLFKKKAVASATPTIEEFYLPDGRVIPKVEFFAPMTEEEFNADLRISVTADMTTWVDFLGRYGQGSSSNRNKWDRRIYTVLRTITNPSELAEKIKIQKEKYLTENPGAGLPFKQRIQRVNYEQ